MSTKDVLSFPDRIIFIHRSAIYIKFTLPRRRQFFLMFAFMRNMTDGLLGSSAILTSSLFERGLGRGRFSVDQGLLLFCYSSFFLSLPPLFHNGFSLREPGSKGNIRSFRRLWGKRPEHRSYVDGPLLDRHVFTYTLSRDELNRKNQTLISEKVHDLRQRIVLKVKI